MPASSRPSLIGAETGLADRRVGRRCPRRIEFARCTACNESGCRVEREPALTTTRELLFSRAPSTARRRRRRRRRQRRRRVEHRRAQPLQDATALHVNTIPTHRNPARPLSSVQTTKHLSLRGFSTHWAARNTPDPENANPGNDPIPSFFLSFILSCLLSSFLALSLSVSVSVSLVPPPQLLLSSDTRHNYCSRVHTSKMIKDGKRANW